MTPQPFHQFPEKQSAPAPTSRDRRQVQDARDNSTCANTRPVHPQAWGRFRAWRAARGFPALAALPELAAAILLRLAEVW